MLDIDSKGGSHITNLHITEKIIKNERSNFKYLKKHIFNPIAQCFSTFFVLQHPH